MKKLKIGFYIPPPVLSGLPASIHSAGIGRIPKETQTKLIKLLENLEDAQIYPDLNFRNSYIKNGKIFVNDFCLNTLDIFFWYCEIDRSVGSYDLEVLKTLANDIKVVINPISFELGLDKYLSHLAIRRAGGSVPETILFDYKNLNNIKQTLDAWGPTILKPRRGGFGKGVTFINNFAALRDTVDYIHSTTGTTPDKAYLLEKYYEYKHRDWISVTMINGEIMYGYRKKRIKLTKLANGRNKVYDAGEVGGEVYKCDIPEIYKNEAINAYHALKCEIIGFDMILNAGKPIIIDENTFPGYYEEIFYQVNRDPANEFYKLILSGVADLHRKL